jgi:rhamnulokinase
MRRGCSNSDCDSECWGTPSACCTVNGILAAMDRSYLALDLGAESGRAMLARLLNHKVELHELHRFANSPVQLPNGMYWDALGLFHHLCEGIRAAHKATDELDGIAVDTWGVDFALLRRDGGLIECPRHYRDRRNNGIPEQVFQIVPRRELFFKTGIQIMPINSLYQLYALNQEAPEVLEHACKLLFMPDLFNYFLTGALVAERTIASTSQLYDPVHKCFATDMLRKLGINGSLFAELVEPGTELGPPLPHVADCCDLDRDTNVYTTGSHDTASAVAAVPACANHNWCYISSGTWSLMGVELDQPIINDASMTANFTNEVGVEGKIRFLKNIPGLWPLQESRRAWAKEGLDFSYADLMERAAAAKPSATVLDLDEFASPGNLPQRILDQCRRTGQQAPADPGETTRVLLHSLAVRYKQVLEQLEAMTGKTIDVIHIVGGGSKNKLLNQLAANITGRRVVAGPAEATAAGNALTQALGRGDVTCLEELRAVIRNSFEVEEFAPAS